MKLRIAACFCPQRHAIAALGVPDPDLTDTEVSSLLHEAIRQLLSGTYPDQPPEMQIKPWCGLCGSPMADWTYEVEWSKEFASLEDAKAELEELGRQQSLTRAIAHGLGLTFDAKRKRSMN